MSARLGWIEKAMSLIPGYRGYKQRELLREDDRLVRRFVADTLRSAANTLRTAMNELYTLLGSQYSLYLAQNPANPVAILENIAQRALSLADQIEHAEMGYSPSFDRLKIQQQELQHLLEIDNKMIGYAKVVEETARQILDQVRRTRWYDTRLIITLNQSLDELEKILAERRRFLHGEAATRG